MLVTFDRAYGIIQVQKGGDTYGKNGQTINQRRARNAKLTLRLTQAEKDKIGEVAAKIGTSRINAIIKGIEFLERQLDD